MDELLRRGPMLPKLFSTGNGKLNRSGDACTQVIAFGIPAVQTCPFAGVCKAGCYAVRPYKQYPNVRKAQDYRFELSKTDSFVPAIRAELTELEITARKRGKQLIVRIHDSGDFYSAIYLRRWIQIITMFPEVRFYAYTKAIPIFRRMGSLPSNFTVVFSYGGIADHLIDPDSDRHCRVFSSRAELETAGYTYNSDTDNAAWDPTVLRVGLVYHGPKSKAWTV